LSEELLELFLLLAIDVVQHRLIGALRHHGELAVRATEDRRGSRSVRQQFCLALLLLDGEFPEGLALAQQQHRNEQFVLSAPRKSFDGSDFLRALDGTFGDSIWYVALQD